ncbi:MAG: DUF664 domain-containing protein [Anaerolineae bacterium]|nr:DUF664 domain-containing protein [Anaerolineae bacterium]
MHPFYADYLERLEILHDDFKQAIAGLPIEALDWVPGPDMNSLCVLVIHTCGAERYWIGDVAAQNPSNRVRADEFKAHGLDEAALIATLDQALDFARQTLAHFSLDELTAPRPLPNPRNRPTTKLESFTAGWALLHALEHTAQHSGHAQITRQLWEQRHV